MGFPLARRVFRFGIFPETANDRAQVDWTTAPFWEKGIVTALHAYAVTAF